MNWNEYADSAKGKTAYIVGKGPTLDNWIADDFARESNSVVIGINQVGNHAPVDYTFTTDGYAGMSHTPGKAFIAVPYGPEKSFDRKKADWFLHCHDIRREGTALRLTKQQVAETRWLYTASSSAQPAIHFAWYMGCEKLFMIGVGGSGYSSVFDGDKGLNTDAAYYAWYQDTKRAANVLFGRNWDHLYQIT